MKLLKRLYSGKKENIETKENDIDFGSDEAKELEVEALSEPAGAGLDMDEYEIVELEIVPENIICPDCGGLTLRGLEFCDKCGGELSLK